MIIFHNPNTSTAAEIYIHNKLVAADIIYCRVNHRPVGSNDTLKMIHIGAAIFGGCSTHRLISSAYLRIIDSPWLIHIMGYDFIQWRCRRGGLRCGLGQSSKSYPITLKLHAQEYVKHSNTNEIYR